MHKYDSLLFGNGLTIGILSILNENINDDYAKYLNCNNFIYDFAHAEEHQRIVKNFYKYFDINSSALQTHQESRIVLKKHIDEINTIGFERWGSKNIFSDSGDFTKLKLYCYLLYNYWYHHINEQFLTKNNSKEIIKNIVKIIKRNLNNEPLIYTTNFDLLVDDYLNTEHLHGKFAIPLLDIKNCILACYNDKDFEYTYLFGGSGLEKLSRLDKIKELKQNDYDISFFYNKDLNFGNLLIYGIAFGRSEIMSDEFLSEYPKYENMKLLKTVDGHILHNLIIRYMNNKLNSITIAYYSQEDLNNYKILFSDTEIEKIITYEKCNKIFIF